MTELIKNIAERSDVAASSRLARTVRHCVTFVLASVVLVACVSSSHDTPSYLNFINKEADFERLSDGGQAVKYLAPFEPTDNAVPLDNPCVFLKEATWHYQFLREYEGWQSLAFEGYVDLVMRRQSRSMWGGLLRHWPEATHPATSARGVVSYSVYAEDSPGNELTVLDILSAYSAITQCMAIEDAKLVFLPEGAQQLRLISEAAGSLADVGLLVATPAELAGDATEIYSRGTTFGTLTLVPTGTSLGDYGPRDLLVLESAPNDIGIVAGLITSQPQNLHSHVNLRLDEKDLPNARIKSATTSQKLIRLDGQLVRLSTLDGSVDVAQATQSEAQAWWSANSLHVGQPVSNLLVTAVASTSQLRHSDAIAYGTKAANSAELANQFAPQHAPEGFAIPFSRYAEHIEAHGFSPMIDAFLADPRRHTDLSYRRDALDDIRDAIRDAPVDPVLLAEIETTLRSWLGAAAETTRVRFRSSTNVEDLTGVSGAGLYDSRSGCLGDDLDGDDIGPSHCLSIAEESALRNMLELSEQELALFPDRQWLIDLVDDIQGDLTDEKPIARAMTKVWRSLWNDRAWEERDYYGIDHKRAFMGVWVNPSFVLERVNTVVLTNFNSALGTPEYRVVSQVGTESVVRPDNPTAIAETRMVGRGIDDTLVFNKVLSSSNLSKGAALWNESDFTELMQTVFAVHDYFANQVYMDPTIQLDLEIKLTHDQEIVVKQVRPYVSGNN